MMLIRNSVDPECDFRKIRRVIQLLVSREDALIPFDCERDGEGKFKAESCVKENNRDSGKERETTTLRGRE